jgi:hypothetical protein
MTNNYDEEECHISLLFFRSELSQLAGSDAGDTWFREQDRGATQNRLAGLVGHDHLSSDSNPRSPQPKPDVSFHRLTTGKERLKHHFQLQNQDIPNPTVLSMDDDNLHFHPGSNMQFPFRDCGLDFGLLFTDAAHTVLNRLGSQSSQ